MKKKIITLVMGALLVCTGVIGCAKVAETSDVEQVTTATAEQEEIQSTAVETADADIESKKEALRQQFLADENEVIVNEDSVTFTDNNSTDGSTITIAKNPENVVNLYASFTTLWYEAGGTVTGCIGGESAMELYEEYIGRDITQYETVTAVATSGAGKKWDVETILNLQPDLIICSKAMSGYDTISAPAEAANIPVVVVNYEDFSDYLKWFKVFCNINGQPELWDSVAVPAFEKAVDVLVNVNSEQGPTVFAIFATTDNISANTINTVVGGMINAMNAVNIADGWENTTGAERLDINLETVYASNPDIIIVQAHADNAAQIVEEAYGDNPVWQSLSAVQNGQVYYLEKELFHNKPNSRFAEAYEKLAHILYQEASAE